MHGSIERNNHDVRLASLVAIVGLACLAGSYWGIVDQLEKVLAVASNDSKLLAMFPHGIELVSKSSLELLASDVGKLGFGDQGFGLSADKLLLEDNNLGGVGLLVLQLSNLVGNLLLACMIVSFVQQLETVFDLRSRLGWTEASMLRMLLIVTRY